MRQETETHEWIELDGDSARVGITKRALQEIGEVVFVELPKVGSEVRAGDEVVILESTKAAVEISSPLTGRVVQVNEKLLQDISLLNSDPEGAGWLFQTVASTGT